MSADVKRFMRQDLVRWARKIRRGAEPPRLPLHRVIAMLKARLGDRRA